MTPQEKAIDLVNKFKYNTRAYSEDKQWEDTAYNAKQCALIAVDEILYWTDGQDTLIWLNDFYIEVKHEIEKL